MASQTWWHSESHSRDQPDQVGGGVGGASGIIQEALRLEQDYHRRRGKVWRAKSTGAPGVMVQGCENWGRSKVWGKWQRTLWPPGTLAPGVVSPWAGSPWSSLQNMFSVPFSSEHGREGDVVFISIVRMRRMVPRDTARKWHSRDLNLDSFFRKCLLLPWHLTASVLAGWWPGRMSGSELSLAFPSCGPWGFEIYLVLIVPNSPLYYSLGRPGCCGPFPAVVLAAMLPPHPDRSLVEPSSEPEITGLTWAGRDEPFCQASNADFLPEPPETLAVQQFWPTFVCLRGRGHRLQLCQPVPWGEMSPIK